MICLVANHFLARDELRAFNRGAGLAVVTEEVLVEDLPNVLAFERLAVFVLAQKEGRAVGCSQL